MTTTADAIRALIIENFLFGDTSQDLADDVSLIEADIVDSTGVTTWRFEPWIIHWVKDITS